MNDGQARVTVLLLLLGAAEMVKQPAAQAWLLSLRSQVTGNVQAAANNQPTSPLSVNPKLIVYWFIAGLALIALAGPLPDVATGLALLLIFAVVLSDVQGFTSLLTPPAPTVK